ncbi:MAG: glycoside hydrolase family 2 protein [Phycisphaerales bacterium]|nr:glycoside hydrolase family 2 protein [Phycisphaerales bacterium]
MRPATPTPLTSVVQITHWRWRPSNLGTNEPPHSVPKNLASDSTWQDYKIDSDIFNGKVGYAWFQAKLPPLSIVQGQHLMLEFTGVRTRAVIFLNGKPLADHRGDYLWFEVPLPATLPAGSNILTILVHNPGQKGPTIGPVTLGTYKPASFAACPACKTTAINGFKSVLVPNDFVVQGKFDPHANGLHGYLPVYPVWYRRTFNVPPTATGKLMQLRFGGVMSAAVVYVNGHRVGAHTNGYAPFRFNISRFIKFGQSNTLAVYVDPRVCEGWWYEGGGIYRHVAVATLSRLHITRWGTYAISHVDGPIHYDAAKGDTATATVALQTTVTNQSRHQATFSLLSQVLNAKHRSVGTLLAQERLAAGATATFTQHLVLPDAHLWSLNHCNLYTLKTQLIGATQQPLDARQVHFGIRTIRFDVKRGFFLNGKPVKLDGTCNHQDFPAVGIAAPADLWWWRVAKLKSIGSNAYRCSHNPTSIALYQACDHLGMLVMDENRELGDERLGGPGSSAKSYKGVPYGNFDNLKAMILRDRNHPSIIMWSLCNEEYKIEGSGFGATIFKQAMSFVKKLDNTRPIMCAMDVGYPHGFATVEDILGMNYRPFHYAAMHKALPQTPMLGSEIGSSESDRGVMQSSSDQGLVTQYCMHSPWSQLPWDSWGIIGRHPYLAGGFVWTGFDYRGEPTPYGWPDINSHFGLLDICGFRKPDAYYYKAAWTEKPMVYIQPQWDFPNLPHGKVITVRCFSNCSAVELFVDGKSAGRKAVIPFAYVDWHIPWQPGTLEVLGYDGAKTAARYTVTTPGPAAALKLTNQWPKLSADGHSIAPIALRVLDAHGNIVAHSMRTIRFSITGPGRIAGTGNGDPASHIPNNASYSRAFYGRCMALVRMGNRPGTIVITASSPGLPSACITIHTVAAAQP